MGPFRHRLIAILWIVGSLIAFDVNAQTPMREASPDRDNPRLRSGPSAAPPTVAEGFSLTSFAKGLGQISAMDKDAEGRLFILDKRSGRLIILTDRALDGRLDLRRSVPHRFDNPTGLAVGRDTIFVADQQAVWSIGPTGTISRLAALTRSGSRDAIYHLGFTHNGALRLGFSKQDGNASLVGLDTETGEASQIATVPGRFIGFSRGSDAPLWVIHQTGDQRRMGPDFRRGVTPPDHTDQVWLDAESNEIFISTSESIHRATLGLNQLVLDETPLVTGFVSGAGRIRHGKPGALLRDRRGLFFADTDRGKLWLLSKVKHADEDRQDVSDQPAIE